MPSKLDRHFIPLNPNHPPSSWLFRHSKKNPARRQDFNFLKPESIGPKVLLEIEDLLLDVISFQQSQDGIVDVIPDKFIRRVVDR